MTIPSVPTANMTSIEKAWCDHLDAEMDMTSATSTTSSSATWISSFTPQAVLLYVPTGSGGHGIDEIKKFADFVKPHHQHHAALYSRSVAPLTRTIVDEYVVTVRHDRPCDWLLPDVEPTGSHLQFSMVIMAEFDRSTDKIVSKRVYWDQASILKQAGLITDPLLPVEGAIAAQRRVQPSEIPFNTFIPELHISIPAVTEAVKKGSISNIFSDSSAPVPVRPTTRLFGKPPGGNASHIFDADPAPVRPKPTLSNISTINFADSAVDNRASTANSRVHSEAFYKNQGSHFGMNGIGAPNDQDEAGRPRSAKRLGPQPSTASHFEISDVDSYTTQQLTRDFASHVKLDPTKNTSQFSLEDASCVAAPSNVGGLSGVPRNARANQSQLVMGDGGVGGLVGDSRIRPSSRVLRPPGGGSSITF